MAWIESHQGLRDHPKLDIFADELEISRPAAIGHLHMLWWYALDHAKDGNISAIPIRTICRVVEWTGDPDSLMNALKLAEFIDQDGCIHDWFDYAGKLIEKRESDAERLRTYRARKKDVHSTNDVRNTDVQGNRTVPYLTVPETTSTPPVVPPPRNGAVAPSPTPTEEVDDVDLSDGARKILDEHRRAHGKRRTAKVNPVQAERLNAAVVDLGVERLTESVVFMAAKGVTELSKAINAAFTKRQIDESGKSRASPGRNGLAPVPTSPDMPDWEEIARRNGEAAKRKALEAQVAQLG